MPNRFDLVALLVSGNVDEYVRLLCDYATQVMNN